MKVATSTSSTSSNSVSVYIIDFLNCFSKVYLLSPKSHSLASGSSLSDITSAVSSAALPVSSTLLELMSLCKMFLCDSNNKV
jgi:hypothetical protein